MQKIKMLHAVRDSEVPKENMKTGKYNQFWKKMLKGDLGILRRPGCYHKYLSSRNEIISIRCI